MPCEFAPRMVNNTYIAVELEVDKPQKGTMYEPKLELCRPIASVERGGHHGRPMEECCREEMMEDFDEKFNPKIFQKETGYQVFGYRSLPRVFSALGEFGVIQETESAVDDVRVSSEWSSVTLLQQSHNPRCKSTTKFTSKVGHGVEWLPSSSPENNHRRSSEGSLVSARDLGSGQYKNYSDRILSDQRSERRDSIDILEHINSTGEARLVKDNSRRSSFTAMNAIPETLSDTQRYYSLPRKLSLPAENRRSTSNWNRKKQRNSFPASSSNSETIASDNDTDTQWDMLVARARSFQKLSSKEPVEKANSKVEKTDDVKMRNGATGFHTKSVDQNRGSMSDIQDSETRENEESVETKQRKKSQEKPKESLKNSDEIKAKESSSIPLTEEEVTKSGQVVKNIPIRHNFDPHLQIDKNSRRYSLATVRHSPEVREKISGYSTHGALEYAKMLLGKIQSEGKTKSKKERLEEMSKALKMVLEELNRIELPDRELVSLFISLRAKIVNLKSELKAEETHELTKNDKETSEVDVKVLSKTLPRVRSTSESDIPQPNFRRFSWC